MKLSEYNLRCFYCKDPFKSKDDVYRNEYGHPVCKDCLYDDLEVWFDPEELIDQLDCKKFNRDLRKWVDCELLKRFEEPYAKEIEYDMALEFILILKKIKESE